VQTPRKVFHFTVLIYGTIIKINLTQNISKSSFQLCWPK